MKDVKVTVPKEFMDLVEVMKHGALKYGADGWMENGKGLDRRSNHSSLCRHVAEYYMGMQKDPETGIDPLLHIATRALYAYYLRVSGTRERLEKETGLDY